MYRLRFRIWDTVENKFFKPEYKKTQIGKLPDIKEILLTQTGEVVYRERIDGVETLTDDTQERFIKNARVGVKDINGKKYHFNDIVCFTDKEKDKWYGVLIWNGDRLGIGTGPIDNYTEIYNITERELRNAEIVGNVYQDRKIIMGDEIVDSGIDFSSVCEPCDQVEICRKNNKCKHMNLPLK